MTQKLQHLQDIGCDVEASMERFLDDEEFYLSCFEEVLKDPAFDSLGPALQAKNIKECFDLAHTLKGIIANLGITPLYDLVVKIVEPLRAGSTDGLLPIYDELIQKRDEIQKEL